MWIDVTLQREVGREKKKFWITAYANDVILLAKKEAEFREDETVQEMFKKERYLTPNPPASTTERYDNVCALERWDTEVSVKSALASGLLSSLAYAHISTNSWK